MLHHAEAYSNMPWVILPVSLLPTAYWWFEKTPELVGLFCPGKAYSTSKDDLSIQNVPVVPKELQLNKSLRILVPPGSIYLNEV
jgi:hypothetical protein